MAIFGIYKSIYKILGVYVPKGSHGTVLLGNFSINPWPECLKAIWGNVPLQSLPFGVTWAAWSL